MRLGLCRGVSGCTLVGLMFLGACGGEEGAEADVTIARPLLGYTVDALHGFDGNKLLTYAPRLQSVCFLSGVSGTLKNTATALQQVFVSNQLHGTFWVAGSSSETQNKTMVFNCINRGIPGNPYTIHSWSTSAGDPAPVDMGPSSDRVCLLTRVEGWFNGGGEQVRVRISNGRWLLDGTMGTLHPYAIGAGAVCIRGVTSSEYSQEYSVTSPTSGRNYLPVPYVVGDVCGLTKIGGKFDGSTQDHSAKVWGSSEGWSVDAKGLDGAIFAGGRCIGRNALP